MNVMITGYKNEINIIQYFTPADWRQEADYFDSEIHDYHFIHTYRNN